MATSEWEVLDDLRLSFSSHDNPENLSIHSQGTLVIRCPEQKDNDVVAEVTHTYLDQATRLVFIDKKEKRHESIRRRSGGGVGIAQYIHRFKNIDRGSIARIQFQKRPYDYWITFNNVSLQPGHQTQVQIGIEKTGSLLGKPLPDFENVQINFSPTAESQKAILVCFFDINQRSSRYSITELAIKAETLAQKNVTIVAVQTSKVEKKVLKEWITENNIPFPIGMIQGDQEKVKFDWGVKGLPWLILTDKDRIVQAEGFGVDEVEEKIKTNIVFK